MCWVFLTFVATCCYCLMSLNKFRQFTLKSNLRRFEPFPHVRCAFCFLSIFLQEYWLLQRALNSFCLARYLIKEPNFPLIAFRALKNFKSHRRSNYQSSLFFIAFKLLATSHKDSHLSYASRCLNYLKSSIFQSGSCATFKT